MQDKATAAAAKEEEREGAMAIQLSQGRRAGGEGGPLPSRLSLSLSPSADAAKTDHVRVIIGIRAACKEMEAE